MSIKMIKTIISIVSPFLVPAQVTHLSEADKSTWKDYLDRYKYGSDRWTDFDDILKSKTRMANYRGRNTDIALKITELRKKHDVDGNALIRAEEAHALFQGFIHPKTIHVVEAEQLRNVLTRTHHVAPAVEYTIIKSLKPHLDEVLARQGKIPYYLGRTREIYEVLSNRMVGSNPATPECWRRKRTAALF